nr:MAG TPA: hypothetical protein [Caudoviricetes sp.]
MEILICKIIAVLERYEKQLQEQQAAQQMMS